MKCRKCGSFINTITQEGFCVVCGNAQREQTNGDRIRTMLTNACLAKLIDEKTEFFTEQLKSAGMAEPLICSTCKHYADVNGEADCKLLGVEDNLECEETILDWLNKPAEE